VSFRVVVCPLITIAIVTDVTAAVRRVWSAGRTSTRGALKSPLGFVKSYYFMPTTCIYIPAAAHSQYDLFFIDIVYTSTFSGIPLSASRLSFGNNFTVALSSHGNTRIITYFLSSACTRVDMAQIRPVHNSTSIGLGSKRNWREWSVLCIGII